MFEQKYEANQNKLFIFKTWKLLSLTILSLLVQPIEKTNKSVENSWL